MVNKLGFILVAIGENMQSEKLGGISVRGCKKGLLKESGL